MRLGYGIGSGAVESAHKQVVHARFRQAGMRWSEAGARRLLALRLEGRLDRRAMLRDTLTALDQLPSACAQFRKHLAARAHPSLEQLEGSIRKSLDPNQAYHGVPGRDPGNV
jgi:hypothetical protein